MGVPEMVIRILQVIFLVLIEGWLFYDLAKTYGGFGALFDLTPPSREEQMSHDMTVFSPGSTYIPLMIIFIIIDILVYLYG